MEKHPIQNDQRRARKAAALGEHKVCMRCGYPNPVGLIPPGHTVLEEHHVVGRHHDRKLTGTYCRNCHAELGEKLDDIDFPEKRQSNVLDRLVAMLRAFAQFLIDAGEHMIEWAEWLAQLALGLDAHAPGWRELPAAQ